MSTQPPPVPPANRSDKGPGSAEVASKNTSEPSPVNPDKTGQQGNSKVNTTNKGLQQDR
ncbi:hypothetical protein MMMDOFMJ_1273 [Methylobacterium gnaphalii]|nr:hypothetical protein MMMDOFMJ_1273 [Methylobacterium gnaphalii]